MAIVTKIVSRETIKPSKLRENYKTYKLCLLDQLAPSFYVPIVLFFSAPKPSKTNTTIVQTLKTSLSKTLAEFYPLAGKIHDNSCVETGLNDGVLFTEAKANNTELQTLLEKPDTSVIQTLLPIDSYKNSPISGEGVPAMAVQFNTFGCGGTALGICMSHSIADGTALSSFISSWARNSLSGSNAEGLAIVAPRLDAAELFPPTDVNVQGTWNLMNNDRIVTRRFVFGSSSLASLKAEASISSERPASRVQALTALISKSAKEASLGDKTQCENYPMVVCHAVNLRPKMVPPLPENTLGNIWQCAFASVSSSESRRLSGVVARLREEIGKLDGDYTEKLKTKNGLFEACEGMRKLGELVSSGDVPFYKFTSWVRFQIYETDFGFGTPCWACVTTMPIEGAVILMSDKSGNGIEAWVNLLEHNMASFETHPELLKFASPAPGSTS